MQDLFHKNRPIVGKTLPVLLPLGLDKAYDYLVPEHLEVALGDFVRVPLGNHERMGVVWEHPEGREGPDVEPEKLKSIIDRYDVPPLPRDSIKFAQWVADYNLMPLGTVVRMMMSASRAFEPEKPVFGVRLAGARPPRMTAARQRVLDLVENGLIWSKADLSRQAGVSTGVIDGLVKAGTLVSVEMPRKKPVIPRADYARTELTEAQEEAAYRLKSVVEAQNFTVTLIDGVTGSGKTEVYFEAVAEALRQDRQTLLLLPEIALTSQFLSRFEKRFGCRPVEWHSQLSQLERGRIWRAVAAGEARAVIGARSALYLPFCELGLIVVDEEHDTSFKQEDRGTYHGRDMAVVRALLADVPIVLASATPSLESLVNAQSGKYRYIQLSERYSDSELPDLTTIDLKKHPPEKGTWLSPVLVDAVKETLANNNQALLFLNRRGYAPLTLCRNCGYRFDCPQCAAWLVEHRFRHLLQCHHCGFATPPPKQCPRCQAPDSLVACGPGVERVVEEVEERFPDANLALLSSDMIPNITALREILRSITEGEADIIVGTQIVAKGHNFPNLALVGVVDGDLGLGQADPRASERTYQLLNQVTGRAGRSSTKGRGLLQTHLPDHPVMQALISGDREAFMNQEIRLRQQTGMPPFGRLASLIISARDKTAAVNYARMIAQKAPKSDKIMVLGPAEAPIAVIRGRHRFRILIKAPRETDIQAYLRLWLEEIEGPKGDLRLSIDIDPYNFL